MTTKSARSYLPAAGHDLFLPFYDLVTRWMGADRIRRSLVEQTALRPGERVLDVGCGTGTLLVLLQRRSPAVEAVGLDPDPRALLRARRKAERAGASVKLDQGFSDALPYPDASFDHVFSSYMLHHLPGPEKRATLREIRRVLKPGGRLHLLDFDGPDAHGHRGGFLHSHARLRENSRANLLALLSQAGLTLTQPVGSESALFGLARIARYEAVASEIATGQAPAAAAS